MHPEILSKEQIELLPLIKEYSRNFYLVGGTAIALQIGHRQSIDFDLFCSAEKLNSKIIKEKFNKHKFSKYVIIYEGFDQFHVNMNHVKLTFFCYPFEIPVSEVFEKKIKMPSLLDLAAMKAYALSGRGKWKDYVDLYFILQNKIQIKEISDRATVLFKDSFNSKLFMSQLSFFDDINYEEKVDFLPGFETSEEEIKKFLIEVATEPF